MLLTQRRANRVVLHNISWQQFENLLVDLGESRAARVAYDDGTLEIMTPLPEHEYYKETISIVIQDIAEVLDRDYESLGSTTWKREIKKAGVEPDNCFYFQNEPKIRGKLDYDLNQDPPPDLVLEIDVTSKSLSRFSIYARLGVPEIWCYDSGELKVYQLQNEGYIEVDTSLVFPSLPVQELPALIEQYRPQGRRAIRRAVREWARR
ncbi:MULTISPECIES: Uma2 family endonuclease [unclassified Coleofasciculus]|uniref:Uma2 family endonuclease n=1 Tax=unclassified Coleofasciculus TaxID=2692782 RepID=UPI001880E41B|nr:MULTISPECIES: Uma2 family endonuclease [unclassified Coleofasciculus]MBE9126294.1 Uma2 family endonuclease [Coleofasciculus sp. LEGE 07081]MBE9149213.1 Uma2 family endonuclease [Coleofasciculus sp. LEGE 07092]